MPTRECARIATRIITPSAGDGSWNTIPATSNSAIRSPACTVAPGSTSHWTSCTGRVRASSSGTVTGTSAGLFVLDDTRHLSGVIAGAHKWPARHQRKSQRSAQSPDLVELLGRHVPHDRQLLR